MNRAERTDRLLRMLCSGLSNDIEEWRLADPARAAAAGLPRAFATPAIDGRGIVFIDLVLDAHSGEPMCHEVNGPNAVGSDALVGDSDARAENEARQAVERARATGLIAASGAVRTPFVTLHAHQHWRSFRTGGEFYPRVGRFADHLEALLPGATIRLASPADPDAAADVTAVAGDVPAVARDLEVVDGRLRWRGRPVAFVGNPNLVAELVRTRKIRGLADLDDVARRAFHAWRLVGLIHDKGAQQRLLAGTGIRPLACFEAGDRAAALRATRELLARGPVVLKPNGGSGGAGVHVVVPAMDDAAIAERIERVLADCLAKYGENAEASAFPIRGFEFVESTGYPMGDGGHLWDLRIAVLFEPGRAVAYPVSIRLAPEPFDRATFHLGRDQWISNVSGRQQTLLLGGFDPAALAAVGVTPAILERMMAACVRWTEKAWDGAARDPSGETDEDVAERESPGFYPPRESS